MNTKTKKVLSVMIISLTLLFCITITYGFFAAQVTGTDVSKSVYFATANQGITISFEGGEQLNLSNIYPRETAWIDKDISIKSTEITSDITLLYTFNMVVEENGYHPEDIKYTFIPKTLTGVEDGTATGTVELTNLDNYNDIGHGLIKGTNIVDITYTLKVYFVNDEARNQNTTSALTSSFYVTYTLSNEVNLMVNLDGGNITEDLSGDYQIGQTVTLKSPTKDGYVFTGWTASGGTINGDKLTLETANVTLTANWSELIVETLSCDQQEAEFNVTNEEDLREALLYNGNSTITLSGDINVNSSVPLVSICNKEISAMGQALTSKGSLINIGGVLSVSYLRVINNNTTDESSHAIINTCDLTTKMGDGKFHNYSVGCNTAAENNAKVLLKSADISAQSNGGVLVYNEFGSLEIDSVGFVSNSNNGFALYNEGLDVVIDSSSFENNATRVPVIFNKGNRVDINSSIFQNRGILDSVFYNDSNEGVMNIYYNTIINDSEYLNDIWLIKNNKGVIDLGSNIFEGTVKGFLYASSGVINVYDGISSEDEMFVTEAVSYAEEGATINFMG